MQAQTPGTLTVSATTSSAGGNYAPRNIVAIWIEDDQGNFVKTLLAYAQTRRTHLNTWEASTTAAGSPFNVVDAITGATRPNHDTRTCSWNGTDVEGNVVSDGTYHLRMELTDKNGTGNFSSFSFTKDTMPLNLTPFNVPSFSAISIGWEPVITSIEEGLPDKRIVFYPNPSSGIFNLQGDDILEVEIRNSTGEYVGLFRGSVIDISDRPDGIYFVRILTGKESAYQKIIKKSR
jgi:hypothetical protein